MAHLAAGRRQVFYVRYHDLESSTVDQQWLDDHGQVVGMFLTGSIPTTIYRPRNGDRF
jgi:hypothetical protein